MANLRWSGLSIRARLALILGATIFALAATRALGLLQLGAFLDRFKSYTDAMEGVQTQMLAAPRGEAELRRLATEFESLRREADEARATEVLIMNRTYVSMLLLVLGAGALAYFLIAAMIAKPLARVEQVAGRVARGDLSSDVAVESRDEIGRVMQSLRDMNGGLAALIGQVRGAAHAIEGGAEGIAAANAGCAELMAGHSAAVERTAATVEHLATGVRHTADNARQATERAAAASGTATRGGVEVERVAGAMCEIEASARRITEVIALIDGIAFQTNLLALNAAVEAAHAGAQGRGFAIVATEVRNLALRSAAAAREVRALIDASLAKIKQGSDAVHSAAGTMTEIVTSACDVTHIVEEIAGLAAQQAQGLEEVSRAVGEIDRSTRHNAGLVEGASRTAHAMRAHALDLSAAVSVFRIEGESGADVTPSVWEADPPVATRLAMLNRQR